ncbi:MAG: hypothetical protein QOH84_2501 [Kribbellaceae bacterium]|nr:hypothetical protein [Kribbellaceae bacterium]
MTAQNAQDDLLDPPPTDVDPIGPIDLPKRSRVGSRALALVGSASVLAVAVMAVEDCSTWHTISA